MEEQAREQEIIVLHDIEGFTRKSGTDQYGRSWLQFEVDYFAEEEVGECTICGSEIEEGWTCLDGGDEVCSWHVRYAEEEKEGA